MTGKVENIFGSVKKTIFVIGTMLVLFTAARNSLIWHLERFWGISHDFWQNLWIRYSQDFLGGDITKIVVTGFMTIPTVLFMSYSLFLTYIDLTGKPKFLAKYKIQEDKNVPVDKKELKKVYKAVMKNHMISSLCFILMIPLYRRYMSFSTELPTFHMILFHLSCCIVMEEFGFYYVHRLLHHRYFYKSIHKMHHEWTAPIGITAIYCHPIEHLASNLFPVLLAPVVCGAHAITNMIWLTIVMLNTCNSHSGYHFPGFPSPEQHDYHHLKFNQCYGVLGILDRLHNTDAVFRAHKKYQRHITSFSLTPLNQLFPDDNKTCETDKKDD